MPPHTPPSHPDPNAPLQASEAKRRMIQVIDSHTEGEPTRTVIAGGPDLGGGSLDQQRQRFKKEFDGLRAGIVDEPRGSQVLVGALLCQPTSQDTVAGVIFFNNVGMLGMCGHGTIGVAVTLAYQGKIAPGRHLLDTPVGKVGFELHNDLQSVTVENVPSYRWARQVTVDLGKGESVVGDIAWGGNWFFLVEDHPCELLPNQVERLTEYTLRIRQALDEQEIRGQDGGEIDHVELFSPSPTADSRNFVLCPGAQWDRSPCGTGTSAKLACLAADGKLQPGQTWKQESVIGTSFTASYQLDQQQRVIPSITGSAWVVAESTLLFESTDPFQEGIPR